MSGKNSMMLEGAPAPDVLVAALGPQMLRLTGKMADGTITWMTGNKTLADLTVPTIREAADEAGRQKPRVVVGLPVLCTDNLDAGRDRAAKVFQIYGKLPSYRAMLDRESLGGPEDICIIGDEAEIRDQLRAAFDSGADDVIAVEFGSNQEEETRTRAALASLL
jgi:alkanesulfonate monooxygenase SsuD/methylene tetrahydromethanopterin reductase-like flavin-dependent oxidoreductase (luciferase family)